MFENEIKKLYEQLIAKISENAGCHTDSTIDFVRKLTKNYSAVLGYSEYEILKALESKRTYTAANYYQVANFPLLDENVKIFSNTKELLESTKNGKFICPACKQEQTDPYKCNSGFIVNGKKCNWTSFGLLGTLNGGFRFTIKDTFLDTPMIENCFLPVSFANTKYDIKRESNEKDTPYSILK